MKLSVVTDEISSDPETAIELATGWGIREFELRGIGTERVPNISAYAKARLRETLEEYNSSVIAISPGLFKIPFLLGERDRFPLSSIDASLYRHWTDAHDLVKYHLEELLPASLAFCGELGAHILVAFSFERGASTADTVPDEVLNVLRQAADTCAHQGVTLAVEVETGCWADTGAHARGLISYLNHPALGVNWDPSNAYVSGEDPYPEGYSQVSEFVRHVHFKDVIRYGDSYHYVVQGAIDWKGQIEVLRRDGYAGYLSVETHMRPKVASAFAEIQRLKQLVENASA